MPHTTRRTRRASLAVLLAFASALSCGRELTGPGGAGRRVDMQFNPVFESVRLGGTGQVMSIGDVVDFTRVRVLLLRVDGDTAVDRVVDFHPESTTVRLSVSVTLSSAATNEGEPLEATLKYINATGDTVFTGGPVAVVASSSGGSNNPPPTIPVRYTGAGANAASIAISPPSFTGTIGQQTPFTAVVRDSQAAVMNDAPVAFTSTDSNVVRVNLRTGTATLVGARGSVRIIAQTLTGQADSADVMITPTPAAIVLVSGGNQQVRQGTTFPQPIRVRVNAVDGLGVAGVAVAFAATRGQGSTLPSLDTTDANGIAEAVWTAGDSAGVGQVTATVVASPLNVVVSGTQLSSAPTALTFDVQPVNFTAGDSLAPVTVVVRDATGDTVSGFTGNVSLALVDGTAGAGLLGTTTREAVNGVATFQYLTIDRAGTAYRLRATVAGVPPLLSSPFNVAPAPARYVTITGGANQTAPALSVLPDSVRARVTNTFGAPVSGVAVSWAVVTGGGTIAPANATTDSLGRVAAQWTIGAAGAQQARALVTGLPAAVVNASVFTPTGTPTLFAGLDAVSMTTGASRTVPVYLNPADVVPVVATLTMRDTLVADWTQDSVIFTAGSTLRSPTVASRAAGSTWAIISSVRGVDSVQVLVAQASLEISGDYSGAMNVGDTVRKTIRLTTPAPVGGVQIQVVTSDPSILRLAPTSGRHAPSDRCYDYYCSDDAMPGLTPVTTATGSVLLAPPSDTILLTIPEGQAMAFFAVVPTGPGAGTITATAANHAAGARGYTVLAAELFIYNYYGTQVTLGTRTPLDVSLNTGMMRDVTLRFRSTNTSVLQVDSSRIVRAQDYYSYDHEARSVGVGSAYIVVETDGFAADSVLLDVVSPFLYVSNRNPVLAIGQSIELSTSSAIDAFGSYSGYWERLSTLPLVLSSSDSSVLRISLSGAIDVDNSEGRSVIRGVAPGTAWLRVSAADHATDSVLVTVTSATLSISEGAYRVGEGQLHNSSSIYLNVSSSTAGAELQRLDIESSDPSVALVLTPTLYARPGDYFPSPTILGVNAGAATLTFTGAGFDTTTRAVTVTTPRFQLAGTAGSGGTFDPDSASLSVTTYTSDDIGNSRPVGDTVLATLRSTDPAVLQVTDSLLRFLPGQYWSYGGLARFIGAGTARLVVDAPGYAPDTSGVFTLRAPRIDIAAATFTAGRGLSYDIGFTRRSPAGAPLPFTVATSGPADLTLVQTTDTIAAGVAFDRFYLRTGAATGTDTVIVSAAGHAPDTIRVIVTASTVRPVAVSSVLVGDEFEMGARLDRVGLNGARAPADTTLVLVSTTDTALVEILDDTVRLAPEDAGAAFRFATLRFKRPGVARLHVTDPTGFFTRDSVNVIGQLPALEGSYDEVDMGPRQRTSPYELYVYRNTNLDDSLWVRLSSSAPSVATPAVDSVLIEPLVSYAYFEVISGDSVGAAVITASADGFAQMQYFVGVTRGALQLSLAGSVTIGDSASASAYLTSARSYQTRITTEPVPLRLRSADPSITAIGADSLVTIPAGESYTVVPLGPVRALSLGTTWIHLEDTRTSSFRQYESTLEEFETRQRRMRFSAVAYGAGVGLQSDAAYLEFGDNSAQGHWIRVSSLSGRVGVVGDSVYRFPGNSTVTVSLAGLTVGVDTLVVTADGYGSDTAIVNVSMGAMVPTWTNAILQDGDSVLVTLSFVGPGGYYSQVTNGPRTLTFTVGGALQIVAPGGTGPTTSIVVDPGSSTASFWMRATGGGNADVSITSPGLNDLRIRVRTTSPGNN